MLAGQLALIVAAIFTGAAAYVSIVEQPARLETWAGLHAVRTALGALATAIFLWASLG